MTAHPTLAHEKKWINGLRIEQTNKQMNEREQTNAMKWMNKQTNIFLLSKQTNKWMNERMDE